METISIKLSDGSVVKVDVAALVERLRSLFEECLKSGMKEVLSLVRSAKRDAAFAARCLSAGPAAGGAETSTLNGAKREQFGAFCRLMKDRPDAALIDAARMALRASPQGGYSSAESLVKYAGRHRSYWRAEIREEAKP